MILIVSIAFLLTQWLGLPWWTPLVSMWVSAFLFLPFSTLRDFHAGMSIDRIKHGCEVVLPPEAERRLEPEATFIVKYMLLPMAMLRNFLFNLTWATIYFIDLPRWGEIGFTMRMNRYRQGPVGKRRDRAFAICKGWLNRADRRGEHT